MPQPQNTPHNPAGLTDAQIGVAEGWRLLYEDEILTPDSVEESLPLKEIEAWINQQWYNTGWDGTHRPNTYRTKLSRAALRAARGLPPEEAAELSTKGGGESCAYSPSAPADLATGVSHAPSTEQRSASNAAPATFQPEREAATQPTAPEQAAEEPESELSMVRSAAIYWQDEAGRLTEERDRWRNNCKDQVARKLSYWDKWNLASNQLAEMTRTRNQLAEMTRTLARLTEERERDSAQWKLRKVISAVRSRYREHKRRADMLSISLEAAEDSRRSLIAECRDLHAQHDHLLGTATRWEDEIAGLKQQLKDSEAARQDWEERWRDQGSQASAAAFALSQEIEARQAAEKRVAELQQALDLVKQDRANERKRADEAERTLAKLPGDWMTDSSLETWFPLTAQRLAELESEIGVAESARKTAEKWQQDLRDAAGHLRKQLSEAEQARLAVEAQAAAMRDALEALRFAGGCFCTPDGKTEFHANSCLIASKALALPPSEALREYGLKIAEKAFRQGCAIPWTVGFAPDNAWQASAIRRELGGQA